MLTIRLDEGDAEDLPYPDAGKKALRDELTALWTRNNGATDGTTRVLAEYVEVIGTR